METDRCTACGEPTVVVGQISTWQEGRVGHVFAPRNCRSSWPGVPTAGGFRACVSCGHVWSWVDPSRLRSWIESQGEEIARQELDEIDHGPYRGLPDVAAVREVAEKIAEIDALARSGKTGAAGRYRELRGVTWDQALKEASGWTRLTRREKLALFGWTPKKKVPVDDLDSPFP
jgi:hypothetical protein